MLPNVKHFSHENGFNENKPLHTKLAASQKDSSQMTKLELMRFISSKNLYSDVFDNLHVNLKFLYNLLHEVFNGHGKKNSKHCFNKLKRLLQNHLPPKCYFTFYHLLPPHCTFFFSWYRLFLVSEE